MPGSEDSEHEKMLLVILLQYVSGSMNKKTVHFLCELH